VTEKGPTAVEVEEHAMVLPEAFEVLPKQQQYLVGNMPLKRQKLAL
jgi:hypothetical protein